MNVFLILIDYLCVTNRKSSSHKVIAVGAPEGPRAGERHTENVEALIPMMSDHFIDAKVRNTVVKKLLVTILVRKHTHVIHMFCHLLQGGSNIIISGTGPVCSKKWLLFERELGNPSDSDVSDVTFFAYSAFFPK